MTFLGQLVRSNLLSQHPQSVICNVPIFAIGQFRPSAGTAFPGHHPSFPLHFPPPPHAKINLTPSPDSKLLSARSGCVLPMAGFPHPISGAESAQRKTQLPASVSAGKAQVTSTVKSQNSVRDGGRRTKTEPADVRKDSLTCGVSRLPQNVRCDQRQTSMPR